MAVIDTTATRTMSNVEAVRAALHEALRADPNVVIMGEDVGARGNVFLITKGFLEEFGPERIIDTPLAEASIVGVAIGMAMEGLAPGRRDPIRRLHLSGVQPDRRRSGQDALPLQRRLHVPARHPHAVRRRRARRALAFGLDRSALLSRARLEDPRALDALRHQRFADRGDRGSRSGALPRTQKTYRLVKGEVPEAPYTIPIGKADVKKSGDKLTVVSYGLYVHQALEAANRLEGEGMSVEVIDLRSIRPMDRGTILESVRKTRKLLIIHEDNKFGGIGAEISAMVAEEALFDLDAPIRRLCGPDVPAMGYALPLEEEFMISTDRMAEAMRELVRF